MQPHEGPRRDRRAEERERRSQWVLTRWLVFLIAVLAALLGATWLWR